MGKAQRIREQNTRQKIAAQQAAARRAEARRRLYLACGSALAVIAIVVGLIVAKSVNSSSAQATASASQTTSVTSKVTSVPASTLNAVGAGAGVAKLQQVQGSPALLTADGKPEMLYVGAEWCPYCAAERWAMAAALSRFGTFSGIGLIHSSSSDVYPSTPTLSFYKSTYTSKYLTFEPVEWYGTVDNGVVQQKPNNTQMALFTKYDAPPYVSSSSDSGSFPFVDIGNRYLVIGAQYSPQTLAKLSWQQVATDMHNPSSPVAKAIDGTANSLTAAICQVVKNAPSAVCSSKGVQAASGAL